MLVAGFISLLTVGRWLDEALSEDQRLLRRPDDGRSANGPWVIVKLVMAAICLAAVLPLVLFVFIVGLISVRHGVGGYWSFAFGFLVFALLMAVVLAIVLALRRTRQP